MCCSMHWRVLQCPPEYVLQCIDARFRHLWTMEWLRLVGSSKLYFFFAEYHLFHRALLQKRPVILRSLLIVATPYLERYGGMREACLRLFKISADVTHCVAAWCVAVCCSVLQCVAVCCNVLQQHTAQCVAVTHCKTPAYDTHCAAVCCSAFQYGAVCCSVLQCVSVFFSVLQCAAVCCSDTLQDLCT